MSSALQDRSRGPSACAVVLDQARTRDQSHRAKRLPLAASVALAHRRALDESGLTQTELADRIDSSQQVVQRMGNDGDPTAPNLRHIAIAPRDYALPLLRWAAGRHNAQVLDMPAAGDEMAVRREAIRAAADMQRALAGDCEPELIARVALRCAEAARAVHALHTRGGQ